MAGATDEDPEAWAQRIQQEMEADAPVGAAAGLAAPLGAPAAGPAPSPGAAPGFGAAPDPAAPVPSGRAEPVVQPVRFDQLDEQRGGGSAGIDVLLDVKLPISVELGRTDMLVKEILECGPGTVIELNKLAGEPVDVYINGRMVAQGEVVVVDEHFGVRVTSLLSPRDRVRSLA
jgi:flagellar motor switch protein FliN/FliY